jgi:ABC-2 type transport system permease protein
MWSTLMRVAIASSIQYRASGAIWMLGMIIEPVIFLVVWSVAARSSGGQIAGEGPREIAAYYLTLMLVNHVTFSWVMEVFQYRIQYGDLSFQLLRPLHPIYSDLVDNLAFKLVMAVMLLPAAAVRGALFQPRFALTASSAAFALLALPLALGLRFCLDWTLALCAFWTTRITAINRIYYSLMLFLGGRAAPRSLLPGAVQSVAGVLPFYYGLGFPTEILLGRLTQAQIYRGLCMQCAFLLGAILALSLIWRAALRRFSAVGS